MRWLHFRLLDWVLAHLSPDGRLPPNGPGPKPLYWNQFERVALSEADERKPLTNQGWSCETAQPGDKYWKTDQPGSVLEFEVAG